MDGHYSQEHYANDASMSLEHHENSNAQQANHGEWAVNIRDDHVPYNPMQDVRHNGGGDEAVAELCVVDQGFNGYHDNAAAQHLEAQLVVERQQNNQYVNAIRQMFGLVQNLQQGLMSLIPQLPQEAVVPYDSTMIGHHHHHPASIPPGRSRSSKSNRPKNRTSANRQASIDHAPLQIEGIMQQEHQQQANLSAFHAQQSPTLAPRPKVRSQPSGIVQCWGRSFLLFAVQHFDVITTGWVVGKYSQGRPSMDRAYASLISLLAYLQRYDPARFEKYLASFSTISSRENAHTKYMCLAPKDGNVRDNFVEPGNPTCPFNVVPPSNGHNDVRPLRQNQLKFRPYANSYIACYGYMENGEFVLYPTPKEYPQDLVTAMAETQQEDNAQPSPMADHEDGGENQQHHRQHHHHAQQQNTHNEGHVMRTNVDYDGYQQADLAQYAQSHHHPTASVLLEGDSEICIDLLRAEIDPSNAAASSSSAPRKESTTQRKAGSNPRSSKHVGATVQSPASEFSVTAAPHPDENHDIIESPKSKRKRKQRVETRMDDVQQDSTLVLSPQQQDSVMEESANYDQPLSVRSEVRRAEQTTTEMDPPAAKKRPSRASIIRDGKRVIVDLEPGQKVFNGQIVTTEEYDRLRSAAQEESVRRARQAAEAAAPPMSISPTVPVSLPQTTTEQRTLRKKWLGGASYQPTPKKI